MNNGEASDVNVVLAYFLKLPRHDGPVSIEEAKVCAVRLADRAYRQLSAGRRGVDVAEGFEQLAAVTRLVDEALDGAIETEAAEGNELAALLRRPRPAKPLADNGPGVNIQ